MAGKPRTAKQVAALKKAQAASAAARKAKAAIKPSASDRKEMRKMMMENNGNGPIGHRTDNPRGMARALELAKGMKKARKAGDMKTWRKLSAESKKLGTIRFR